MSTEVNSTDLKHRTLGPNELKDMNSIETPSPNNENTESKWRRTFINKIKIKLFELKSNQD